MPQPLSFSTGLSHCWSAREPPIRAAPGASSNIANADTPNYRGFEVAVEGTAQAAAGPAPRGSRPDPERAFAPERSGEAQTA
jgi:hypothetical protein